jgi:hypothetical protein
MFFSNSAILVHVEFNNEKKHLKNISFEENGKFFSLVLNQNNKSIGEFHWSESFACGKLNIVNFLSLDDDFFLFTSSVQNYKPFEVILKKLCGDKINVFLKRLPLPVPPKNINISQLKNPDIDPYFGISGILDINGESILTKIYTNGLITYTMMNNLELTYETLRLIKEIIEVFDE